MDKVRIEQPEKLGMVWSHQDVAWEEGTAAARGWAEQNGHLLAPLDATHQGYRVGTWLKNQRTAARKPAEIEQRRAEGLPMGSSAGALPEDRREQLDETDPSWPPAWPADWQRAFHLVRLHLKAGGELPIEPGIAVHQGENLGQWVKSVRFGGSGRKSVKGEANPVSACAVRTRPPQGRGCARTRQPTGR
ncbi:helicase associated domain-containing protein [Streptomyces broussonetiae]|uniref:helicase associated domain-containing protein n=1 Tax=Streptomyces broussonetiae TaxID=2686304 RepID=UPI0035D78359